MVRELPTVRIIDEESKDREYLTINEADFDPKIHKKWRPKPKPKSKQ